MTRLKSSVVHATKDAPSQHFYVNYNSLRAAFVSTGQSIRRMSGEETATRYGYNDQHKWTLDKRRSSAWE